MTDEFTPLTVAEYASRALRTDQGTDGGSLAFPFFGLFGETGSLLSEVKKKQRDKASYIGYAGAVVEELGDVLWYLTSPCPRRDLAQRRHRQPHARLHRLATRRRHVLTFAALQPEHMPLRRPDAAFENTLLRLAGQVGLLVTDYQAGRLNDDRAAFADRLIAIIRGLIQAANEAGVTLEVAAVKNLGKIFDRWPEMNATIPSPLMPRCPRKGAARPLHRHLRAPCSGGELCVSALRRH